MSASLSQNPVVLKTQNLCIQFGGLKAVSDFCLDLTEGMIFGLIGPNGAGKTTCFNILTGVYKPTSGELRVFGQTLEGLKPCEITQKGIARTFQNIRLFKDLSVLDNLMVALDNNPNFKRHGFLPSLFKTRSALETEKKKEERAIELLKIFEMDERSHLSAKNLPYGDQRKLEIARAMATGAKILLLDEPAAGLNPQETHGLMNTIRMIRDKYKMTIFLIEHDMKLVMGICERIAVLDHGIKIAEGTPEEIQKNPKVIEAYLGKSSEEKPHG